MALHDFGRDVLFVSQTGSGKTLMFLLPMLEQLGGVRSEMDNTSPLPKASTLLEPHGLIIVPTPDLAAQVQSVASKLAAAMPSSVTVKSLCGGSLSFSRTPSILVGTTDELYERLQSDVLSTRKLRVVAVDEVDAVLCTRRVEDATAAMQCAVSHMKRVCVLAHALRLILVGRSVAIILLIHMHFLLDCADRVAKPAQGTHDAKILARYSAS